MELRWVFCRLLSKLQSRFFTQWIFVIELWETHRSKYGVFMKTWFVDILILKIVYFHHFFFILEAIIWVWPLKWFFVFQGPFLKSELLLLPQCWVLWKSKDNKITKTIHLSNNIFKYRSAQSSACTNPWSLFLFAPGRSRVSGFEDQTSSRRSVHFCGGRVRAPFPNFPNGAPFPTSTSGNLTASGYPFQRGWGST